MVSKPSRAASRAVARTQWSVAMPTTSTSVTSRARSQAARPDAAAVALEARVRRGVLALGEHRLDPVGHQVGWKSTPPVPTTQCTGQEST